MNCLKLRAELRENGRSRHVDLSGGNKVSVGEALHLSIALTHALSAQFSVDSCARRKTEKPPSYPYPSKFEKSPDKGHSHLKGCTWRAEFFLQGFVGIMRALRRFLRYPSADGGGSAEKKRRARRVSERTICKRRFIRRSTPILGLLRKMLVPHCCKYPIHSHSRRKRNISTIAFN